MWKRALLVAIVIGQPTVTTNPSAQESGGFKVVVNSQNSVSALSSAQLANLYSRRTKKWDNGEPVQPVHQVPNPVRDAFSRDVLGTTTVPGESPMPAVASDRDVLAYVRLKPGAIGYVSASAPVDGVKVLSVGRGGETTSRASSVDPLPVGGPIEAPPLLVQVRPFYPQAAREARITGTVKLLIVIGPTGNVERATVVESVPMLDNAALRAVKQWKYAATKVNSVAVAVSMVVGVSFVL